MTAFWIAGILSLSPAQNVSKDLLPVHQAYSNGDFEEVMARIEAYQKRHPEHSQADSVFIAKHLGVIYASNPLTREKGRYYMFHMLEMNPSADLVDMFISQDMDEIFEKVRKEFFVRQNRSQSVKTVGPAPSKTTPIQTKQGERSIPLPVAQTAPKSGDKTWLWIAGGAAIVAGAVTTYYFTVSSPEEPKNIPLD